MNTEQVNQDVLIPRWFPVLLAVVSVATWVAAVIFARAGSELISLLSATMGLVMTYTTVWSVGFRRRLRMQRDEDKRDRVSTLMPVVAALAALALAGIAFASLALDYGTAFFVLSLVGGLLLGAWAGYALREVRRFRARSAGVP